MATLHESYNNDPNVAYHESHFIHHLCNCDKTMGDWCFIHNTARASAIKTNQGNNGFGYIATNSIRVPLFKPGRTLPSKDLQAWAIKAHQLVRQSNCPNYKQARIRVPSELNINNWRQLCGNYHDQLLLDYLEFGFPLCVDRTELVFNNIDHNHPSAEENASDVETYLLKEIKHQAVVGPFNNIPFEVHYSPMLTRPKPDDTRRVIVNLSYPYHASVNDNISATTYDGVEFELKYPSVDNIVDAIKALDSNALLSKIDISRAFRNLRVDPHDFDLLGLKWRHQSYLDLSVPMGLKTGSAMCQRTTDVIRHVMRSKNIDVYNYSSSMFYCESAIFMTLFLPQEGEMWKFIGN